MTHRARIAKAIRPTIMAAVGLTRHSTNAMTRPRMPRMGASAVSGLTPLASMLVVFLLPGFEPADLSGVLLVSILSNSGVVLPWGSRGTLSGAWPGLASALAASAMIESPSRVPHGVLGVSVYTDLL